MARRRRNAGESTPRLEGGLPEPLPSSPTRPPTHVIYCQKDSKVVIVTFCARYAAYHFLYQVQEGEGEYKWLKRKTEDGSVIRHGVTYESGMRVEMDELAKLEDLLEGPDLTEQEEEWELPPPYPQQINILKHYSEEKMEEIRQSRVGKTKAGKVKREPGPSKAGLITVQDIAAELKMEPGDARAILRKHSTKPAVGWAWDTIEVADIKALLMKHAKGS